MIDRALAMLEAVPFARIARHPDLVLAAFVAMMVGMMVVPLPPAAIDLFLGLNLTFSILILVAVLFSTKSLSIASFPTILLLTTFFRLALNISTTRLILSKGDAGSVVRSFGEFVLSGDVVVGVVIFLTITLVQFVVIAKGAERVAEVGARFTLDALPGKQLAIDAAARAGSLTEEEAEKKRDELSRESGFYGAMDGAMKFVKGDAIVGLAIIAINMIAGMAIGVLRFGWTAKIALERYSLLSVGDGMVSQIPAILITLSAAIMTTRIDGSGAAQDLGSSLKRELFGSERVLAVVALFPLMLSLVPGLPAVPFLLIAVALGIAAALGLHRRRCVGSKSKETRIEKFKQQAKAQRAISDNLAPAVVPIGIDLDVRLSAGIGVSEDDPPDASELVGVLIPQLRDALYFETGIRFPGIRVQTNTPGLAPNSCVIRIKDVPVAIEHISPDHALALESPDRLKRFGIIARSARHPLNGTECALIPIEKAGAIADAGISVFTPSMVIVLHFARILRASAKEFIGIQETSDVLERLEKICSVLVREVVPKVISLAQLTDVLQRLAEESVSIRDLKSILEALARLGARATDTVEVTEYVRSALSQQIGHALAGTSGRLSAILLDPLIEDSIRAAIVRTEYGGYLALDPEIMRSIIGAIDQIVKPVRESSVRPVIITPVEIRRYVRKLLEEEIPDVTVLSFQELPPKLVIQPLGRAGLGTEQPSEAA